MTNAILVLGIGGSTRPNSTTELALRVSLAAAGAAGAETLMLGSADLLLPLYEPDGLERAPKAARLLEEIRRADGLIIASPGYHGALSGMVKNALDYLEDTRDDDPPYLEGKAVGSIATATGWQATMSTIMSLRSVVHALRGWPTPMGATINTAREVFDQAGECVDPVARFQLELVGQQVVEFARMRAAGAAARAGASG
ncbi:MAG TPA: NAD(P)H-dependent oxidoreductase [Actinomycetota bacterium]